VSFCSIFFFFFLAVFLLKKVHFKYLFSLSPLLELPAECCVLFFLNTPFRTGRLLRTSFSMQKTRPSIRGNSVQAPPPNRGTPALSSRQSEKDFLICRWFGMKHLWLASSQRSGKRFLRLNSPSIPLTGPTPNLGGGRPETSHARLRLHMTKRKCERSDTDDSSL